MFKWNIDYENDKNLDWLSGSMSCYENGRMFERRICEVLMFDTYFLAGCIWSREIENMIKWDKFYTETMGYDNWFGKQAKKYFDDKYENLEFVRPHAFLILYWKFRDGFNTNYKTEVKRIADDELVYKGTSYSDNHYWNWLFKLLEKRLSKEELELKLKNSLKKVDELQKELGE